VKQPQGRFFISYILFKGKICELGVQANEYKQICIPREVSKLNVLVGKVSHYYDKLGVAIVDITD